MKTSYWILKSLGGSLKHKVETLIESVERLQHSWIYSHVFRQAHFQVAVCELAYQELSESIKSAAVTERPMLIVNHNRVKVNYS